MITKHRRYNKKRKGGEQRRVRTQTRHRYQFITNHRTYRIQKSRTEAILHPVQSDEEAAELAKAYITEDKQIEGERWRYIRGYSSYIISDYGRIMGTSDHKLKSCDYKYRIVNGKKVYTSVQTRLYDDRGHLTNVYVHRLVAATFIKNTDRVHRFDVHHINVNPIDNRAVNLMWVSRAEHKDIHAEIRKLDSKATFDDLKQIAESIAGKQIIF